MFKDLIDFRKRKEERNWCSFIESEVKQLQIHNRFHLLYNQLCLCRSQFGIVASFAPGFVIYFKQIVGKLWYFRFLQMPEFIVRIFRHQLGLLVKSWRQRAFHSSPKCQLIKINLESVRFEKIFV